MEQETAGLEKAVVVPTGTRDEWLAARAKDITSTEVAALFGVSPYLTAFDLWHRKKNQIIVEIDPNERMTWGTRLQTSIAEGIAEDQGWKVSRMPEYMRLPGLRMGASFDFSIDLCDRLADSGQGLLEVKNVDGLVFKQGWVVEGDFVEAPPHVEMQLQHQLIVADRRFGYIGALIGGNRLVLIRREPVPEIVAAIKSKVADFWKSIEANTPPLPDFSRDAKLVASLHGYADPGKFLDASGDVEIANLAEQYRELGDVMKKTETDRQEIKARLLEKIGTAEKVHGGEFTICAGMIGPAHVEFDKKGYRDFRVLWKKGGAK